MKTVISPAAGTPYPADAVPRYRVEKVYGHAEGLSCCFRQWQAEESHCRFLHGYALAFGLTFAASALDGRGWVIDFGGLKELRAWLHTMFDHTLIAAADDPSLPALHELERTGLARLRVLPSVGCEAFAAATLDWAGQFARQTTGSRVWVERVTVWEHEGNAASITAGPGA